MSLSKLKSTPIMKTDIKGFSTHVGLLNDLELSNLLEEHKSFIKNKTEKYKGAIIKIHEATNMNIIYEVIRNFQQ